MFYCMTTHALCTLHLVLKSPSFTPYFQPNERDARIRSTQAALRYTAIMRMCNDAMVAVKGKKCFVSLDFLFLEAHAWMETWAEPPRTRLAHLGQAGHGLIRGFVEAFYFCSGVYGVANSVA